MSPGQTSHLKSSLIWVHTIRYNGYQRTLEDHKQIIEQMTIVATGGKMVKIMRQNLTHQNKNECQNSSKHMR